MGGYYAGGGLTPEQREQMRQEAMQESHQEGVQEHSSESEYYQAVNEQFPTTTDFHAHGLDSLKAMLSGANPSGVKTIGENWKKVHNRLVGEDGSGTGDCAHGMLKKAVDGVLQHWEGSSADQFRLEAEDIMRQMRNTASHCNTTSQVMEQMSTDLGNQQQKLAALEEPGWFDSAWDRITDSGRDDTYTQQDVKDGNLPKDVIAEINEGYLSEGKEVQLQAVAVMETLARTYVGGAQRLRSDTGIHDPHDIPPSNPTSPMPTPIPAFSGSTATPGASRRGSYTPSYNVGNTTPNTVGPRDRGITGGKQVPYSQTQLDTVKPGISGPAETLPGGGTTRTPGPSGGTTGPNTTTGIPGGGMLGGNRSGGRNTTAGGPRAGIRGAGSGAATGKGAARGGFRGMGAMGGGGAGGGRAAGSGGRGPLARAKGGVAGAPKGIVGGRPATPGGTGLGKGRGGASGSGSGRGRGMLAGAARGSNQRPGEEENEQLARPDYLVEDEETWTPEDNRSTPGTIE